MDDRQHLPTDQDVDVQRLEPMHACAVVDWTVLVAGVIPVKYKQLMALGVAWATQRPSCIETHAGLAKGLGASEQEIEEVLLIATALRAGGAITHGTDSMKGA